MPVAPSVLIEKHDSAKFSETAVADPALPIKTEGGYAITRPRTTRRPRRSFSLGFTDISNQDKEDIQALYDESRGGSDIITGWTHPVTGVEIQVRFKVGSIPSFKYHGFGNNHRWDVSGIILEEV